MRRAIFAVLVVCLASCGGLDLEALTQTTQVVTGGSPLPTETNAVTFVAVLTSDDGNNGVAGGDLLDDQGATYGPFVSAGHDGTFSITLTFEQLNQVEPINFAATTTREFSAKFYGDGDASSTVVVELQCRGDTGLEGACGGVCTVGDCP
jgi:hypothetical protein